MPDSHYFISVRITSGVRIKLFGRPIGKSNQLQSWKALKKQKINPENLLN